MWCIVRHYDLNIYQLYETVVVRTRFALVQSDAGLPGFDWMEESYGRKPAARVGERGRTESRAHVKVSRSGLLFNWYIPNAEAFCVFQRLVGAVIVVVTTSVYHDTRSFHDDGLMPRLYGSRFWRRSAVLQTFRFNVSWILD